MARLPYLNRDDLPEAFRAEFERKRLPNGKMMNLHRIMAYRPRQLELRAAFSAALNHDTVVPPRLRELAQLTVGRVTRGLYEYHHHIERGLKAGLTEEHIMALPVWERHPIYTEPERAVIRYAEEMTRDVQVKDATFDALHGRRGSATVLAHSLPPLRSLAPKLPNPCIPKRQRQPNKSRQIQVSSAQRRRCRLADS